MIRGHARLRERARPQSISVWHPAALPGVVLYRGIRVTHPYPRHWHDELHVCAYSAGVGGLRIGGATHTLGPGDFALTPAGEMHENWVLEDSGCDFRSAYLDLALLERIAEDATGRRCAPRFAAVRPRLPGARAALVRLNRAVEAGAAPLRTEGLFYDLCRALLAGCAEVPVSERRLGNEHQAVRTVRGYLEAHHDERVTLAYLADLTGLNPFYLNRVFCRDVGVPPHAFHLRARINRAKHLVRAGLSLAQVAAETGFADQAHLTRHFCRLVGVPPGRFRT